jgi:hypothetical protein
MLDGTIGSVDGLIHTVRRGTSVNINGQETKARCLALTRDYFENVRPKVVSALGEINTVLLVDEELQRLVRLAQGNNARTSYRQSLAALKRYLVNANVELLTYAAIPQKVANQNREEALLLDTLTKLVPSAAASYQQGLTDLRADGRISYRGTAAEFRETLRETLDHLAPDGDVVKQSGFKLEGDLKKPTMKQKVRYVLSSRERNKTQRAATENSINLIDELTGAVTRAVYDQASLATHVQQSRREVEQIKRYVDVVLFDLLELAG